MADLEDINRGVAHVLRVGVLVSVGVLVAGIAIAAVEGAGYPDRVVQPGDILGPLLHLRPAALLSVGVLVLLLTPLVRVVLALIDFAKGRDRLYVAVAAVVLLNLLVALSFGIA